MGWGQACKRTQGGYGERAVLAGQVGSICTASCRSPAPEAWGRGEKWHPPALLFLEKSPRGPCLSVHHPRSANQSSRIPQAFCTLMLLRCLFKDGDSVSSHHPPWFESQMQWGSALPWWVSIYLPIFLLTCLAIFCRQTLYVLICKNTRGRG